MNPHTARYVRDYLAFGLRIRSEVELPELTEDSFDTPDVTFRLKPTASDFPPEHAPWEYRFGSKRIEMVWPPVARVTIDGMHEVEIEPAPSVEPQLLAFPLLGPVMSLLLFMRGMLVLHGSGVAIDGQAFIFLGDKLAGKSTTAATLVAAGHRLLSDDVVAIEFADGRGWVRPAFPQIKLSDAASSSIRLQDAEPRPLVRAGFPKRQHRLRSAFDHEKVPVHSLFVLSRADETELRRLPRVDALKAMMRYSHLTKHGEALFSAERKARYLGQCAALAQSSSCYELVVPRRLDDLPEITTVLERHAAALTETS